MSGTDGSWPQEAVLFDPSGIVAGAQAARPAQLSLTTAYQIRSATVTTSPPMREMRR
jgi:hypothetical protein